MCINCPLNDRLTAPLGGFISSEEARGDKINGKTKFNITA